MNKLGPMFIALISLLFSAGVEAAPDELYLEKGGIVAIEAESTDSRLGQWKLKTDVQDFKGTGHLEFTGNKPESGPPKSPLKYHFKVTRPGKYQLTLRARKRLISKREDICNDCYVSLKGDFGNGSTTTLSVLKNDTKMFGGRPEDWGWTTLLDVDHKKHPAIYILKPEEVYEFTISGRSQNFNIDRILFVHENVGLKEAQRQNPPESDLAAAGFANPDRVKRILTNTKGTKIEAELMELKNDDTLICLVNGRRFKIPLKSLSDADRKFLRQWKEGQE